MTTRTTEFRYVGQGPDELTGGKPLAPGATVKLTDAQQDDPHNRRLIESRHLIATKERAK